MGGDPERQIQVGHSNNDAARRWRAVHPKQKRERTSCPMAEPAKCQALQEAQSRVADNDPGSGGKPVWPKEPQGVAGSQYGVVPVGGWWQRSFPRRTRDRLGRA